ncbi:MAG: PDZ domain-containing protein [Thermoanaerobaculales bacterium]
MVKNAFVAGLGALLLIIAFPALGQESDAKDMAKDTEKQMRQAEEQVRQAERQMRDAERALRDAARQMAKLEAGTAKAMAKAQRKVVLFGNRPRLGVVLKHESDAATDSIGAVIEALTPGGPAEDAGLRVGDIITKFNGQPLAGVKTDADEDESAPAARLIELAGDLKESEKVTVDYRRGSESHTATITASKLGGPGVRMFSVAGPNGSHEVEIPDLPEIEVNLGALDALRSWCDLDLVGLNADLGEYFGAKEGVLVVRAPKDDALELKAGDVIISIGGRVPTTPAQTVRILRSYDPGEHVAVELLRNHKKLSITVTLPRKMGLFRDRQGWGGTGVEEISHERPVAPVAPAPPLPPVPPVAPAPAPPAPHAKML